MGLDKRHGTYGNASVPGSAIQRRLLHRRKRKNTSPTFLQFPCIITYNYILKRDHPQASPQDFFQTFPRASCLFSLHTCPMSLRLPEPPTRGEGAGDCTLRFHCHHTGDSRPEWEPGGNSQARLIFGSRAQSPGTQSLNITSFVLTPLSDLVTLAYGAAPSPQPSAVWRNSGEGGVQAYTLFPSQCEGHQPERQNQLCDRPLCH